MLFHVKHASTMQGPFPVFHVEQMPLAYLLSTTGIGRVQGNALLQAKRVTRAISQQFINICKVENIFTCDII